MAKVYLSPSNHGVGQNKCLWSGCYEDKDTRPIAEVCAKYLKEAGIEAKVAAASTNVMNGARTKESDAFGADLYVPIHTNASSAESARYLMFMFWADNAAYRKIFNAVAPRLEAIYPEQMKAKYAVRKDLYEVKNPKAKTLYCELGFHTNHLDCDNFIHNYEAVGKALAEGICEYFGVKAGESKPAVKPAPKPAEPKPVQPTPAAPAKKKVLEEDGSWGTQSTIYTQKLFGTVQDGIVSNQRRSCKKYLPNAHTSSWQFKTFGTGSPMVKALQRFVGATVDGLMGKETVIRLQLFLQDKGLYTGAIDGVMGAGTVRAWQKYLNSQF